MHPAVSNGSYDVARTGAADATRSATRGAAGKARSAGRFATRGAADATRSATRGAADATRSAGRSATRGAARAKRSTTAQARRARTGEPWAGYDAQTADQIRERLADADDDLARAVRDYEGAHKKRAGVLDAARRELASA